MIRRINRGEEGYPKWLPVKYQTPVFTNEYISGLSLLDMGDRCRANDDKPILEFMKSLNRETLRDEPSFIRRNSV
jgi:hypothetical protein